MRFSHLLPICAAFVFLINLNARADLQYTSMKLGAMDYVTAMNDSGQMVGWSYVPDPTNPSGSSQHGFLLTTAGATDLGVTKAKSINNAGVIGAYTVGQNIQSAVAQVIRNGVISTLGPCIYEETLVNNNGQIVYNANVGGSSHPMLISNGTTQDLLPALGGTSAGVSGFSDTGYMIGQSGVAANTFLYHDGNLTNLSALSSYTVLANAVNSAGQVIGTKVISDQQQTGFLYNNGTMSDLPLFAPDGSMDAASINGNEWVVGGATMTATSGYTGFLYHDGKLYDLNKLVDTDNGRYYITFAYAINDAGQIAVNAHDNVINQSETFLLTPISTPEPGSALLLAAGAAGLLLTRRSPRRF